MRVISGKAKGHRLKRVPGDTTRPIMDRVKENLFNIVGWQVIGTRWLDLYAGTGQIGIEALSRGAAEAIFIDNAMPAIQTIKANLRHAKLAECATVHKHDALTYLRSYEDAPFDVIYIAPPQYKSLWQPPLRIIDQEPTRLLQPNGDVIIQIDPKEFEPLPDLTFLKLRDQRKYGNTMLGFYSAKFDVR